MMPTPPRALVALLLAAYPKSLRTAYRDDLAAAFDRAWRTERAARPARGAILAIARTLADGLRARAGSRAEARWLRRRAGTPDRPRLLQDWTGDLRYAARAVRRSPGFFGGVLFTLALGIGANAAVFSLVKAVVLQPLPYDRPDELVMVWRSPVVPREFWRLATTPRFLLAWREQAADIVTVAGVAGIGNLESQMDLETPDGAERLRGAFATPDFFDVLGARPLHGRLFTAADETGGHADVVVLGHSLWARVFGRDPAVVGRTITLATGRGLRRAPRTFTIVGVLGPSFRFTYPDDVEVWAPRPWSAVASEPPDAIGYHVVGRLMPGLSIEAAGARLAALHEAIRPTPATVPIESRLTTKLERVHESVVADTRRVMGLLTGVAVLLLLITCATAASALLIRVSERGREMAMRTALGAGRTRLLRQLLVEGAALAGAATAAGIGTAVLLLPALRAFVPASVPRGDELGLDPSLVWFGVAAVAVVTMLGALTPAWRGSRFDAAGGLKRRAGSVAADRATTLWRRTLVGLQAGVTAVLLIAAGLLLASFSRLTHVPLGFDAAGVLTVEMRVLDRARYRHDDQLRALQRNLVAAVAAVPGVRAVAMASAVPFRGVDWTYNVDLFDTDPPSLSANVRQVDPAYFSIVQIPLRRGRLLADADAAGTPSVAVVSEGFARQAFGDADPIGREIGVLEPHRTRIVGVVADVRYERFDRDPSRAVYLSRAQHPSELMCLLVDAIGASPGIGRAIRQAIRGVEPALPAMKLASLDEIVRGSLADRRFYTVTTAAFAGLAFLLTLAGLTVIVARTVVERRRELAIRSALGATAAGLQARVVWQGLLPVAAGVAAGLAGAYVTAPALATFLFDTPARDEAIYAAIGGMLVVVAMMAGWIAGRAATRVSPSSVLRGE